MHVKVDFCGEGPLTLHQSPKVLDLSRAADLLARVGGRSGSYRLSATMPPGGGAGASTAALVALARAAGGDPAKLVGACLAVEGASDPLMLPQPDRVLWASREGRSVAELPPLPRAEILGGFWGPGLATDPADTAFDDISDLARQVQAGASLPQLAQIASQSARRCSARRGPADDPTEALAAQLGALGHLRAHTGSARGLIFAPSCVPDGADQALRAAGFTGVLRFQTGGGAA